MNYKGRAKRPGLLVLSCEYDTLTAKAIMTYLFAFLAAFFAVVLLVPLVLRYAVRCSVIDLPKGSRKIHTRPTPLLGGIAIFAGLVIIVWYVALKTPYLLNGSIRADHLFGFFLGGLILMIGGYLDDRYDLPPIWQIIFSIIAVCIVIGSGIGIRAITNPFGGTFSLAQWERVIFWWHGIGYRIILPADIFTFVWLMVVMYTTKLLDGLDGLVSGITVIGAMMIFLLATATKFFQPEVGMLAILIAGVFAGFLFWNWHPAKIFLGEGGSTFAGFSLGILAIISGGKIATALLVLGIPLFDAAWVLFRRSVWEKRSPMQADRKHLHFRLLDAGFSHRTVVIFYLVCATLFGVTTLFLQSREKLLALGLLTVGMIAAAFLLVRKRAQDIS